MTRGPCRLDIKSKDTGAEVVGARPLVPEALRRNSGRCDRFSLIVSRRSGSSARRVLELTTPIVS
jgi:hypothetical protein